METIILKEYPMSFIDALQYMLLGKCIGILPGDNSNYVVMFKPDWMNKDSKEYILKWNGKEHDSQIRTDQFLGTWYPVIYNHKQL